MTAQIPQGLIRVVSATKTEVPSDPADVIYQRRTALFNFWKVHAAQSRATNDVSSIRCRQLFWRVWGDQRLSISLSETTLMSLWLQCQRPFDLAPFELRVLGSSSIPPRVAAVQSNSSEEKPNASSQDSATSSASTVSISPSQLPHDHDEYDGNGAEGPSRTRHSPRNLGPKPGLTRTPSGETSRKRSNVATTTGRGKARPTISRKRSSQTEKTTEPTKPRKSIIKSPRSSSDGQTEACMSQEALTAHTRMTASPSTAADLPDRKISAFELPSASWQSVESQTTGGPTPATTSTSTSGHFDQLVIDKDFRGRFLANQHRFNSSTNLAGVTSSANINAARNMRKTGSVVRFADEVDVSEGSHSVRNPVTGPTSYRQKDASFSRVGVPATPQSRSWSTSAQTARTEPEDGNQLQQRSDNVQDIDATSTRPWRPAGIERHDSVGSVAAVSDSGESDTADDHLEGEGLHNSEPTLPRVRSELSLGIADLKRSQSLSLSADVADHDDQAVTSRQIEAQQNALISGLKAKPPSAEEQKLLAMGRRDGVTRAGGVNLPKELVVAGDMKDAVDFDGAEESHF